MTDEKFFKFVDEFLASSETHSDQSLALVVVRDVRVMQYLVTELCSNPLFYNGTFSRATRRLLFNPSTTIQFQVYNREMIYWLQGFQFSHIFVDCPIDNETFAVLQSRNRSDNVEPVFIVNGYDT